MFQVVENIKATHVQLLKWVRSIERSIPGEIVETEDKLHALFCKHFTDTNITQMHELCTCLHLLLAQEEAFWRQRSKENWLCLGDKKNKIFSSKNFSAITK